MKVFVQQLKGPVRHPEFVWPGVLVLAVGVTLGLVFYMGGGRPHYFLYAPVFGVCGITLLMRLVSGSLLYVGVLALALLEGIGYVLTSPGPLHSTLAILAYMAMAWWGVDQFKYHLSRSAKR
jgi:hypothetical protein